MEKKLNWESSSLWKESDYLKLAEIISNSSNISISSHTLKRLFGKIKHREQYNPQIATKDALSKFLGYDDWSNFIHENISIVNVKKGYLVMKRRSRIKKTVLLYGLLPFFFVCIGFLVFKSIPKAVKESAFVFDLMDSIGTVPYTATIKYNISKMDSDSIWLDFDFVHPMKGPQKTHFSKEDSTYFFSYQVPGYYHIQLNDRRSNILQKEILVLSKNWDSYFTYETDMKRFWMDNEVKSRDDSTGFLNFSKSELEYSGLDQGRVFYLTNRLFNQFNIDGDNFEMETRFKNSLETGGISCFDVVLRIICEKGINNLRLMEAGCSQFSGLKFGELIINGNQNDLSAYKVDPSDWNHLKVTVKQKQVQIKLNGMDIFSGQYDMSNGNIVGIENMFKGSGVLDFVRLKDLNSGAKYQEEF